jgi:CheY-like chemotaxis protein
VTQVIANLLNNAAKFTPPGGRIRVTLERKESQAAIRIRDNGIGIPQDQLRTIFDLFAQAGGLPGNGGGLGIGLSLVRRLVEMHSGTVEVSSDGPGTGAEFVVRLPLSQRVVSRAADGEPTAAAAPRRRVLLVDDHDDARETLAQLVRLWGHELRAVGDVPAALDLCGTYAPEVVIIDIGLPGMNGHDLAQRLRQLPGLADAVLIALTGHGLDDDRRRSLEAGIDHHVVKPADTDQLRALIETCGRASRAG